MLSSYKKVLTAFAHPDDETLAAGGTIARLSELGAEVFVAIPATGVYARKDRDEGQLSREFVELRQNCFKALRILGVNIENVYFGEFPDNELDSVSRLALIRWLEPIVDKVKPDLILTHHRYCTNIDHQYCHEAVVIASRPGVGNHVDVLSAEVPSSTGYLKPVQWEPQLYVELEESHVDAKIKAMQTYKGEARPYPHPRSPEVLKALAMVRGSESGFNYAEAFVIQKMFG